MIAEAGYDGLQRSVASLENQVWDVLIVGAGPAGSTAAAHLAQRGHSVLLTDRHLFPRDKPCGDILLPDALRCLQRLQILEDVEQAGYRPRVVSIHSPSRHTFDIPGWFLTLRRRDLDAMIAARAVESGASFCRGNIESLDLPDKGTSLVSTRASGRKIEARVVLIATGANVKLLGDLDLLTRRRASGIAARCYVRSSLDLDQLIFAYDRSTVPGYAWIFPMKEGLFNLGCGVLQGEAGNARINLRKILDQFTAQFPAAGRLMADAEVVVPLSGAQVRCGLTGSRLVGCKNVLAIGETIGATFPFTGEGIGKAMESAEVAAELIDLALRTDNFESLQQFPDEISTRLKPRYRGYELAERWLSKPWLNDLVMWRTSRSDYLQGLFAGIVDESIDPSEVFSLRAMLRSLWS